MQKHDDAIIDFAERNYPEECSWLQEDKVLAEAEAIRLKAKWYSASSAMSSRVS
jgi:hypothetical protein